MSSMSSPHLVKALAESVAECLDASSLDAIAKLQLDPQARVRLRDFATKANEGELSSEERSEYESFIDASEFLGLAQLRARARLGLPLTS